MSDNYFVILDALGNIQEISLYPVMQEELLDAQIRASLNNWIYLPIDIRNVVMSLKDGGLF